ncbi:MAG: biopolymer transporter ExbD [Lentisphaerae bacterium]|nr:biopolymer transporter ExbD [Lentisphaerota bacterium]
MAKGRKKRTSQEKPTLEMTPMIDCVFQLLIFFIVTMKQDDILANLDALRPQQDDSPVVVRKDPLTVLIGPRGFVFQGAPKTEAQLEYSLKRIAKSDPNTTVIVKCTGDSPHGLLVRALDVCNKVGLRNLSVFSM